MLFIDLKIILSASVFMLGLAFVLSIAIVFLAKKFYVKPDNRQALVRAKLTGANCGACGYPGCDAFSKALTGSKAQPTSCPFLKAPQIEEIKAIIVSKED